VLRLPEAAVVLLLLSIPATAWCYEPRMNYALHCMGCHTPDGSGTPDRVPAIRDTLLPFAGIPAGRQFLVRVPGSAQSTLSDAELAGVLNWMIESFSRSATFERFTAGEVARYRSQPLIRVREERQRLLQSIR
jgi:hypothetical protein